MFWTWVWLNSRNASGSPVYMQGQRWLSLTSSDMSRVCPTYLSPYGLIHRKHKCFQKWCYYFVHPWSIIFTQNLWLCRLISITVCSFHCRSQDLKIVIDLDSLGSSDWLESVSEALLAHIESWGRGERGLPGILCSSCDSTAEGAFEITEMSLFPAEEQSASFLHTMIKKKEKVLKVLKAVTQHLGILFS